MAAAASAGVSNKENSMRFSSRRRQLLTLATLAALAGCAKPPPPPTLLKAQMSAQTNVNPDARKRPSPVTVRVYTLKARAAFDNADFFALYEKDKETLGADLVDKDEFQLKPGENRSLDKLLAPEVAYLGVFAAFRDLERAQWRTVVTVVPRTVNVLQIVLEQSNVTIMKKN
jgi:type VI secretion system protein VasD